MEKQICYKNHNKIKNIYKYLISEEGKINFKNRVEMLKKDDSKKVMLIILKKNWLQYKKLIEIIKKICLNIINNKLSNVLLQTYANNLYIVLNKIKNYKKLNNFIYKLLNERILYNRIIKFYEILSNKSKCILLFK